MERADALPRDTLNELDLGLVPSPLEEPTEPEEVLCGFVSVEVIWVGLDDDSGAAACELLDEEGDNVVLVGLRECDRGNDPKRLPNFTDALSFFVLLGFESDFVDSASSLNEALRSGGGNVDAERLCCC